MKQVAVRIRLRDSVDGEPTEYLFENIITDDGSTPLSVLANALKNLSLSYRDVEIPRPTMRDAKGATLGTAELTSSVTDGLTYEFALLKRVSDNRVSF